MYIITERNKIVFQSKAGHHPRMYVISYVHSTCLFL